MAIPVDLRLLHPLVVLARELHYGRAAQVLALTQPALTQQIQRLERQSNLKLFIRSSAGVEITPEGRRLAQVAEDALAALDGALSEISLAAATAPLRLGHTPLAVGFAPTLRDAADQAGALAVVSTAWECDLMADVRTGRFAATVGHVLPDEPGLAIHQLDLDPLRVVARGLDATATDVHLLELRDRELLLSPSELHPSWRSFVLAAVAQGMGQAPDVRTVPVSMAAWRDELSAGLDDQSFRLLPASSIPEEVQSFAVAPAIAAPVMLAWSSTSIRPELHRTLALLRRRQPSPVGAASCASS